jgi:tagaturonate reductase
MDSRPRLSRDLVASRAGVDGTAIDIATLDLPEKIVQFGTGAFLRGFAEFFVDEANRRQVFNGSIVAVSSTGSSRNAVLNEQDGLFTLAVQGMDGASPRRHYRVVSSLSRALSARDEWDAVLALARDPRIELIISNTTEVGIALDSADAFADSPPRSFPAKLTRFLAERAVAFGYCPTRGLVILPCELIERNGDTLRDLVRVLARRWALGERFDRWLEDGVTFCNTLVDRIVPGVVSPEEAERASGQLGYRDGLLTACETYALFAIEGDESLRYRIGFAGCDSCDSRIVIARDISPFRERKVRLLNGAHTIVVPVALLAGLETVSEACDNERVGRFLRRAMLDEIVPSLSVPGGETFARETLDRLANPFIRHSLIDITLHGTAKMRVRVVPSIVRYWARTGRVPSSLAFGFAAHIALLRGELQAERRALGLPVPDDSEGDRIRAAWCPVDLSSDAAIAELARVVCADGTLWGDELSAVDGFADAVAEHLVRIVRRGVECALDVSLTEPAHVLR